MRKSKSLLALVLALSTLAGCAGTGAQPSVSAPPSPEPSTPSTPPAATATVEPEKVSYPDLSGQTVIVYTSATEEHMVELGERFTEATGCKVESIRLSAGEALARIAAEKENPQADLWFAGGVDNYIKAKQDGLLTQYRPTTAAKFSPDHMDSDGYFTGVYFGYLVLAYNETLLKEAGLEAPTSWKDLLDPAYKGQISMPNPATSGTAYSFLSTICQLFGEEEGMKYMVELDKNIKAYEKSGSAPSRLCAQGEVMVAISYFHDITNYMLQGFDNLKCVVPSEGTGYEMACTGLINNSPNPEAGKALIDFALAPENVTILQEQGLHSGTTNPDGENSELVTNLLKDANIITYDFNWSAENRVRLIEEWGKAVQK